MTTETKYGIISDIHRDPRIIVPTIEILKSRGAEKLILNGDIGNSQDFVGFILDSAGKSGLETYVQPGSHEKLEDFEPVIKYFQDKYSNLINAIDNQKVNCDGHELVFLPGSDFRCGGQYALGNNGIESRIYKSDKGIVRITDINDLTKLISNPDKTIVLCHVPRKFNNLQYGVDMAEFGEVEKEFFADLVFYKDGEEQGRIYFENGQIGTPLKDKPIESYVRNQRYEIGSIFPIGTAKLFEKFGAPIQIKKENRGNEDLKNLYEKLGIRKAVNGHFHESGHRACDNAGNYVQPNQFVDGLFWNSGYCDAGQTGILIVKDNQVKYQNINF